MASNEILLLFSSVVSLGLIYAAWKFNRERLYSVILLFLILISVGGGKIVEFFGFATNTGNIFYASVFLATYFLIERYGKREGFRSIWIGVIGVISFFVLLHITLALTSVGDTSQLSDFLSSAFVAAPRLALASLLAYIASQSLNVLLYTYLKSQPSIPYSGHLWLRVNVCNVLAQLLDSIVFFTIAFWGIVAPDYIGEILVTGFIIKVAFVMLFSPLLYLNRVEEEDGEKGYASLTVR